MKQVIWRVLQNKSASASDLRLLIATFGFQNLSDSTEKNYFLNMFNHNEDTHRIYYQVFHDTSATQVANLH